MNYISTRGGGTALNFQQATLAGLSPDGGLYVPSAWPVFSAAEISAWRGLDYPALATRIISRFTGECISPADLECLLDESYRCFGDNAAAPPLTQLDDSLYFLELFHGPTLAFKDFALQFLGRLFEHFLSAPGQSQSQSRCIIIGATSGDTGSAAIEALRGIDAVALYMLHPAGRVSAVQRRQMTTVVDHNIHNIAVRGDFDDCQNLVKAMFADAEFRRRHTLAAVNSINWARICAQTVYYFYAALRLGAPAKAVNFAVPSGNFGNVFAAYAARQMGLPIARLIIGSNSNDILTRFFASGRMARNAVSATLSPSMDIQVSSNFERYLFELLGRDSEQLRRLMAQFTAHGEFRVADEAHRRATALFSAYRFSDPQTTAEMHRVYAQSGKFIDPHSAIGIAAARRFTDEMDGGDSATPTIAIGTAHPAKFGAAVTEACGASAPLPESLQAILTCPEKLQQARNDVQAIKAIIDRSAGR